MTEQNILETAIEQICKGRVPTDLLTLTPEGNQPAAHLIAVPNDMTVRDLTPEIDKLLTKLQPWRRMGTAHLSDIDSLIAWANRNKGDTSALFADTGEKPRLTCIADYLGAGAPVIDPSDRDPKASYMQHRGTYAFPMSPEWQTWTNISGQPLSGAELGEFVEANAKDLLEPTPNLLNGTPGARGVEDWEVRMIDIARQIQGRFGQYQTLIQLARNFQVNEVSNVQASLNRDTGESSIQFLNEHQQPDGSAVQIPNLFMIAIPIFEHGAHYRIPLRFRYRKAGAAVKFIFTLHNADVCLRDAVDEALAKAQSETGLPLFRGSPE